MDTKWTLWTLPAQPLPTSDIKSSVFVTIWAFTCVIFASLFHRQLSGPTPVWPEFKSIRNSTILLAFWYTATATDRWLHYEERAVPYGYVLVEPILHVFRVISAIWLVWGTYKVVWNELERRFDKEKSQGAWWLAAKIALFLVVLVSSYHVVLSIAAAVAWLQFLSLNIIADVATKRNHFEQAMTAFFAVFGSLTVVAAIATIFFRAKKREGSWAKTRVCLVLATIALFARSLMECVLVAMAQNGLLRQRDFVMSHDIAYGLLTSLYLLFMFFQARQLVGKLDMGHPGAEDVRSDVRAWILDRLSAVTQNKVLVAPPFRNILNEASEALNLILDHGPLSIASDLTAEEKFKVANNYIGELFRRFSHRAPQPRTMPAEPQPSRHRIRFGRQTAPPMPSLSTYESLRSSSNPQIRNASSVPDMREPRFAPRGVHDMNPAAPGLWQPSFAPIEEHRPQAAYPPAQSFAHRRVATAADANGPSFRSRAEAAGFFGGQQPVPDLGAPGHDQQRGQFGPPGANPNLPIHDAGRAQFAYPPDSFAPRPHVYPEQGDYHPPRPQGLAPQPAQGHTSPYIPQLDSQDDAGAYPSRPADASHQAPRPRRRVFEPRRNSPVALTQTVPDTIVP